MALIWLYTLLSVCIVSLISLVGVITLSIKSDRLQKLLFYLVSFSAGALLGDVFIHILPEIMSGKRATETGAYVLAGILGFFILERFSFWHQSHTHHDEEVHSVVYLTIIGDALHNFLDGMAIAASFLVSIPIGIATTTAVIFHEIPQEIGQFAILVHGGWSKAKALWYNFISALTSVAGAAVVLLLFTRLEEAPAVLLAFGAASFIYIALSDLVPALHKENGIKNSIFQFIWMVAGIMAMAALLLLE